VPKQSLQSEMRCSSQTGRLLYCTHLIRFFILLPIAEAASLPRRQLPSLKSAWRRRSSNVPDLCCRALMTRAKLFFSFSLVGGRPRARKIRRRSLSRIFRVHFHLTIEGHSCVEFDSSDSSVYSHSDSSTKCSESLLIFLLEEYE